MLVARGQRVPSLRAGIRSRLQGGLCRGRSGQQGSGRAQEPMDHDGAARWRRRRRPRPPANSTRPSSSPSKPKRWPKLDLPGQGAAGSAGATRSIPLKLPASEESVRMTSAARFLTASQPLRRCPAAFPRVARGRRSRRPLRHRPLRQCARAAHDRYACAACCRSSSASRASIIGIGAMRGKPPHLVGRAFLDHFGIAPDSRGAHAFTFLDFEEAAHRYGRSADLRISRR